MEKKSAADTARLGPPVPASAIRRPQPLSGRVRVDFGALSHPGRMRPNNEDHYIVLSFSRTALTLLTNLPEGQVPERFDETAYAMGVADGMGGASAGELASSLALIAGLNLHLNNPKWILKITEQAEREQEEMAQQRFREIDYVLTEKARSDPALEGMGTTLTVAYSVGADLFIYHVGDSRAYLYRQGELRQLTRDHTLAQALADAGRIPPEEVSSHRLRHVLTRAVGNQGGDVETESHRHTLADGDRLLLCSDGLTDMVDDAAIAAVLARAERSEDACRALVELALAAGGKDNVTVLLARYTIPEAAPAP
jgi:serine/threonine protein phosphatase PrpC